MPSYAVLGATGSTGNALVQVLLQNPQNTIHAYARSRDKFAKLNPAAASSSQVKIFDGSLEPANIRKCITGVHAVFLAVAASDNIPYCSIAQDSAHVVVTALEQMRKEDDTAKLPRLVVLSSSNTSERLSRGLPWIAKKLLHIAASYVYDDLEKAEVFLRLQGDWLTITFIKPGGLVHDAQKGHRLSVDEQKTFLSFLDLAAGMVEVADTQGDTWDLKDVAVVPTADDVAIEWGIFYFVFRGVLLHFFPWIYTYWR